MILQRELLEIFLSGLSVRQRETDSLMETLEPEKLASKLDCAALVSGNLYNNTRSKNYNKKRRWCSLHKTNSHSDNECLIQKDQHLSHGNIYNKQNFLVETRPCDEAKVAISIQGSQNIYPAIIDTGATSVYVNPKEVPNLDSRKLNRAEMTTFGNNAIIPRTEAADIKFSFVEGEPHTYFRTEAKITPSLLVLVLIGQKLLESKKALIDYDKKNLFIENQSVPFSNIQKVQKNTCGNDSRAVQLTSNLVDTNKSLTSYEDLINELIQKFRNTNPLELDLFPEIEHSISLKPFHDLYEKRTKPYSFSYDKLETIQKEISNLLEKQMIIPANSPITLTSFLVKKRALRKRDKCGLY